MTDPTSTPDSYPRSLTEALALLQTQLPAIVKDEEANVRSEKGSYSYRFADLAQITEKLMPTMGRLGLAFTAAPTLIDGKLWLVGTLLHVSGDERTGLYPLPASGTPQTFGSAVTYGRRYLLTAMTGIAPAKDDDDAAAASAVDPDSRTAQRASRSASNARARTQTHPADDDQPRAQRASRTRPATVDGEAPAAPTGRAGSGDPDLEPWTDAQRARIMASFGGIGVDTSDRATRLDLTSRIVGVRLKSANELTVTSAGKVIEALDEADAVHTRANDEAFVNEPNPLAGITFLAEKYPELAA